LRGRVARSQERHNLAVLGSWDELIDNVGRRPGMFVGTVMAGRPATADPSWPPPAPSPVSEDDLAYPEDDAKAIAHLFARLREYLDSRPAPGDSG
jgi:hypothetical protein